MTESSWQGSFGCMEGSIMQRLSGPRNNRDENASCRFFANQNLLGFFVVVLNEKQRSAKRLLIQKNREKRQQETLKAKLKHEQCYHDCPTEEDRSLIDDIVTAFDQTGVNQSKPLNLVKHDSLQIRCWRWVKNIGGDFLGHPTQEYWKEGKEKLPESMPEALRFFQRNMQGVAFSLKPSGGSDKNSTRNDNNGIWQHLEEVMTPSILKVVEFSKRVPGFAQVCSQQSSPFPEAQNTEYTKYRICSTKQNYLTKNVTALSCSWILMTRFCCSSLAVWRSCVCALPADTTPRQGPSLCSAERSSTRTKYVSFQE